VKEKITLMVSKEAKVKELSDLLGQYFTIKISDTFSELPTDCNYILLDESTRDDRINLNKHLISSNNELKKTNMHLEQQLRSKSAELLDLQKELETLSQSISYDLRIPLRAISGFSQILFDEYSPNFGEEGKRLTEIVTSNVQRMSDLIDALLSYSYFNRYQPQPVDLDMNRIVQQVYKELTTDNDRQNIDLEIENLPNAYGDPMLIRKVWYFLISNAIKFTRTSHNRRIKISARELSKELVYTIKDNGVGFDMQYSDKLFNAFQKLHSETKYEGVGMSLALAKRAVKLHRGLIWGEGVVDKGASFHFSIPKFNAK
jgi:two-component system sensor kinase